ncbi:MAG: YfhO family protein [Ruminococcus sp.]
MATRCRNRIEEAVQQVTPLETTAEQVRGDTISGTITTEKDGWFVLSVPYDTGFTVTVDGKKTAYEKSTSPF